MQARVNLANKIVSSPDKNKVFLLESLETSNQKQKPQKKRSQIFIYRKPVFEGKEREIIDDWKIHEEDINSADVQIGLLTEYIQETEERLHQLQKSPVEFKKVRLQLIEQVGKRLKLLQYLKSTDYSRYTRALEKLLAS